MADPIIWGPIEWRAMFALAKHVDQVLGTDSTDESTLVMNSTDESTLVMDARILLTTLAFCFPCD